MGIEITISSKGQIVIPKDVRDALGLKTGSKLTLERAGDKLILKVPVAMPDRPRISYEEFRRRVPKYEGPPVAVEDMSADIGRLYRDWQE